MKKHLLLFALLFLITGAMRAQTFTIEVYANPTDGGTVTGGGTFPADTTITIMAEANPGYSFINWTKDGTPVSTNSSYRFKVTENATYIANFEVTTTTTYTITVSAEPENVGCLVWIGDDQGQTTSTFNEGDLCTVHAEAAQVYTFQYWTVSGSPFPISSPDYTFTVTDDRDLVAHFEENHATTYTISVSATEGGSAYVGDTPGTTELEIEEGQECTVHAMPISGYQFTKWTENQEVVSTDADYSFTVNADRNLVAHFEENPATTYTISVSATEGGSAYVGDMPGTTELEIEEGRECTVHAVANSGYEFVNWTENQEVVSTNADYSFTVNADRNLVANFELQTQSFIINVSASPSNSGTAWVENGGTSGTYQYGQNCTVHANANSGYIFVMWTENGVEVSTSVNYTFQVTANRTLVAQFQINTYIINVSASPSNGGIVSGGGTYQQGESCTVTATANPDYTFLWWTENGNPVLTVESYTFTVTSNRFLVAQFQPNTYTINVESNNDDWGTVSGGGQYYPGVNCTLHANPANGYQFDNWKKNGVVVSSESSFSFEVTADATYTAYFSEIPVTYYTITISVEPEGAGTATESSQYPEGSSITLTATANNGYSFTGWMENGNLVSSDPNCTITVTSNRSLVANFIQNYGITIEVPDPICSGETLTLTEPGHFSFFHTEWQLSPTDDFVTYEVYDDGVLDASYNGWYLRFYIDYLIGSAYSNIVQITVNSVGELNIEGNESASVDQEVEYEVTIDGDNNYDNYSFDWNVSDEQASTISTENHVKVTWKTTGEQQISVTVTDKTTRCSASSSKTITVNACIEDLQTIVPKYHHTTGNDSVILILVYPNPADTYQYQWYRDDNEIPGATDQYYYQKGGLDEGVYTVKLSLGDDCFRISNPYSVNQSRHLRIYPNPSYRGSTIVVEKGCDGQAQLNIYSTDGRLLHTQTVTDNQATIGISLPQGVYVAYLTDSEGYTKVCKLIIQ